MREGQKGKTGGNDVHTQIYRLIIKWRIQTYKGIQTYRHANKQTHKHTDIQTYKQRYRKTYRHRNIETCKYRDIQIGRHTKRHTNILTTNIQR